MPTSREEIERKISRLSPEKRALFLNKLRHISDGSPGVKPIPRRGQQGPPPLSFAQQRMWFLNQLEPGNPFYNVTKALFIKGRLDLIALEKSVGHIINRHETLRTVFSSINGKPAQVILPSSPLEINVVDLEKVPVGERMLKARDMAIQESLVPFDLSKGPLIRVTLIKLGEDEQVLLLNLHHIISDGWSLWVFFHELEKFYRSHSLGESLPELNLPIQYADFACWQRERLQDDFLDQQLGYWKERLGRSLPVLELFTDKPRKTRQSYRGKTQSITLSLNILRELKSLSRDAGVTLFMTLLAAFQTFLYRYSGQEDIIVGTPIANRNRAEIEGLIGFFVNTLVMRTDLSGDPGFDELLGRVREVCIGAYDHQDLPFEKLVEELKPERDMSRTPLFQVLFQLRNVPKTEYNFPGLKIEDFPVELDVSKFDLYLDATEQKDGLLLEFEYNTDLFNDESISLMMRHFKTLLASISGNPREKISKLSMITNEERTFILDSLSTQGDEFPVEKCLHELFEEQVKRTPQSTALVYGDLEISYKELDERANQIGRYLRDRGVGPEVLVYILVEPSPEMVISSLGVLKAGGAYVPLDTKYPRERIIHILGDAKEPFILVQKGLLNLVEDRGDNVIVVDEEWELIKGETTGSIDSGVSTDNLAFVIHTSGSTGKPKGVMITHRVICNDLMNQQKVVPLKGEDRVLLKSSFSFISSAWEMFAPLIKGATVYIARQTESFDAHYITDLIMEKQITALRLVPSLLKILLESETFRRCRSLKRVIATGEALPPDVSNRFHEYIDAELFNLYGPTETGLVVTHWLCRKKELSTTVPIGRPFQNSRIYMLDKHMEPVPPGVPGHLYIGGKSPARGYLNNSELTNQKFVPDPFGNEAGGRIYGTGDLARFLPDGNIEYLGRADRQLKVRGYRIEPIEIESALRKHPAVKDSVVIASGNDLSEKRLVAYCIPTDRDMATATELRNHVKGILPEYMIPSTFVFLDEFPQTISGKVDLNRLPPPGEERPDLGKEFIAPEEEMEMRLAKIWEDVLKIKPIGVHDNFFDLGGHSLLAVELFYRIESFFGERLPLATLFYAPTVSEMARILRQKGWTTPWSYLVPVQPEGSRTPFFCAHAHDYLALTYRELSDLMGGDQPFYVLLGRGMDRDNPLHHQVEEMAAECIGEMRSIQPEGPYYLGGICLGGKIVYEMAQQLRAAGEEVNLLLLFDAYAPGYPELIPHYFALHAKFLRFLTFLFAQFYIVFRLAPGERLKNLLEALSFDLSIVAHEMKNLGMRLIRKIVPRGDALRDKDPQERPSSVFAFIDDYVPKPYPGKVTIVKFKREIYGKKSDPSMGWKDLVQGELEIHELDGYQRVDFILKKPNVQVLAKIITNCLEGARKTISSER